MDISIKKQNNPPPPHTHTIADLEWKANVKGSPLCVPSANVNELHAARQQDGNPGAACIDVRDVGCVYGLRRCTTRVGSGETESIRWKKRKTRDSSAETFGCRVGIFCRDESAVWWKKTNYVFTNPGTRCAWCACSGRVHNTRRRVHFTEKKKTLSNRTRNKLSDKKPYSSFEIVNFLQFIYFVRFET